MIRRFALIALVVAASACDSKTTPTLETPENTIKFKADLTAAQEVPPITGAEANTSGTANITLNLTRDSRNVITGGTVDFSVSVAGFPAGSAVNLAHIHTGFVGTSSGILVNTGLAAGEVALNNGSATFTKTASNVAADVLTNIAANPAGFYFNVHSTANPGGVVRGQLVRQ